MRPLNAKHVMPAKKAKGQDDHSGLNTQVIAIQVPIEQLTNDQAIPTTADAPDAVVGIWAGASRLAADGTTLTQVSRVGDPMVEDWLIPYGEKAAWRAGDPVHGRRVRRPLLDAGAGLLINEAYPRNDPARTADRADLVALLGQGLPGREPDHHPGRSRRAAPEPGHPTRCQAEPAGAHGWRPRWVPQRATSHG